MELTTALLMKLHNIAESLEGMKKGERNVLTAYSYNHFNETSIPVLRRLRVCGQFLAG